MPSHYPSPALLRLVTRLTARPILNARVPVGLQRRLTTALSASNKPPAGTTLTETSLGGIPTLSVAAPGGDADRLLVHLHGGAYVIGSPRTYTALAGQLSQATGATVLLPDYRLAPEHPFPAAVEDAVAVWDALAAEGHRAGSIVVAGDSAGGGLALALALRLRDRGAALPAALVLLCPWLDLSSRKEQPNRDPALTAGWLDKSARSYIAGADPSVPELAPLSADLTGLPPLVLQSGQDDLLAPDARRLAERAGASGIPVQHREFAGVWHDFQTLSGKLREADEALEELGGQVRAAWERATVAAA
jgi:acetyl esterase/lipase